MHERDWQVDSGPHISVMGSLAGGVVIEATESADLSGHDVDRVRRLALTRYQTRLLKSLLNGLKE